MSKLSPRLFPVLLAGMLLFLLAVNFCFRAIMLDQVPWYFPLAAFASDFFLPGILLALTLFLRSKIILCFFSLTFFIFAFIKTVNVILYFNIMEIISYANVQLLLVHTEPETLRILFGPCWFLLAIGIVLVCAMIPAALIVTGWRFLTVENVNSRTDIVMRFAVLLLLLCGMAADRHYKTQNEIVGKGYFRREFVIRPVMVQMEELYDDCRKQQKAKEIPAGQYGFLPGLISPESETLLTQWGLLPLQRKTFPVPEGPEIRKIIVIAAESLNLDYLRTESPEMPEGITPFLDRINREYVSFNNYFTCAQPTSWALDCIFLSRVDFLADLKMKTVSLCDLFREKGWTTYYFTPTTEMCFNAGKEYTALFRPEHVYFQEKIYELTGVKGTYYWGLGDFQMFDAAYRVLSEQAPERFFCVISTIDLHDPYVVSGPAADEPSTGNKFLDSLRGTDRNLQIFLDKVMASPLYDEHTLIVVTADHSATFGFNYTKRKDFMPARIPLIMITKNNRLDGLFPVKNYASQIDLAPTLLGLTGIPVPETFMGKDLRSGKNFALTKTVDMVFLHLPGEETKQYYLPEKPVNRTEKALSEFLQTYYGRTE